MTQTILPRTDSVMDWGAKRRLIAATPDKSVLLFIRPGHQMLMGYRGGGCDYIPTALILHDAGASQHGQTYRLAKGRISNATIRDHRTQINEVFGRQVANCLDVRRTMWVTEGGIVEITDRQDR